LGGQGKQGRVETRDSRRVTTGDADRESPQPSSSTTNSVIPEAVEDITRASGTGGAFSRPGPAHERNSDTTRRRRRATVRTAGRDREAHHDTHEREREDERERGRERTRGMGITITTAGGTRSMEGEQATHTGRGCAAAVVAVQRHRRLRSTPRWDHAVAVQLREVRQRHRRLHAVGHAPPQARWSHTTGVTTTSGMIGSNARVTATHRHAHTPSDARGWRRWWRCG
jgi:hypothetical protein